MSGSGLTWGGAVFMLASWTAIGALLVFCFSRLLGRR